jgi:hypothetical protein
VQRTGVSASIRRMQYQLKIIDAKSSKPGEVSIQFTFVDDRTEKQKANAARVV